MNEQNGANAEMNHTLATAILGLDTLWGGNVMNQSGTGRFIADSWFSDQPLPEAYTSPAAAKVREAGGISGKQVDREAIDRYLAEVDVKGSITRVAENAVRLRGLRRSYMEGLALSLEVMWDLVMEMLGRGEPVAYERCVIASTGAPPEPSRPEEKRRRVAELLKSGGYLSNGGDLGTAADAWRRDHLVPSRSIPILAGAFISDLEALVGRNMLPRIPPALRGVPRANIRFLAIENAWFSGSMNYIGRARREDGSPEYEATYELNASLQISIPEFIHLVSHEVVPGHVTTFAYLQNLYTRGKVGFEASVQTMNTRGATLSEGIANNGILIAHGVTEIEQLPDPNLQIGVLLSILQDDGKNQSSYLTWKEHVAQQEVAATIKRDFLLSDERADKLSGAWGRHPLMGRMYLPCYRAGTEVVAQLRREHPPEKILPVLFSAKGLVDVVTIRHALS